jgi:hypothetical protein
VIEVAAEPSKALPHSIRSLGLRLGAGLGGPGAHGRAYHQVVMDGRGQCVGRLMPARRNARREVLQLVTSVGRAAMWADTFTRFVASMSCSAPISRFFESCGRGGLRLLPRVHPSA